MQHQVGAVAPSGRHRHGLYIVLAALFLDVLGAGLIIPVLPGLIRELSGTAGNVAGLYGWLVTGYSAMQFLFAPLLGQLSDRYGRRPVMLLSMLGAGLSYLLLAAAPGLAWLLLGRLLAGVAGSNITVANAYIADITPPERRAIHFGYVGAACSAGFVFGPALGGLLGAHNLRWPFLLAAVLSLLTAGLAYFLLSESRSGAELAQAREQAPSMRQASPLQSLRLLLVPSLRLLALSFLLLNVAGFVLSSIWVLFTEEKLHWSPQQNGLALTLVGLSSVAVQAGLMRPLIRRLGERQTAMLGALAGIVQFLLMAFARNEVWIGLAIVVGSLAGLAVPALQSQISGRVAGYQQGAIQGALASLTSLMGMLAPLLATTIFSLFTGPQRYFPGAPFVVAAALMGLGLLVMGQNAEHKRSGES